MAVPPVRALELERFEGTFNRARVGGAAIAGLLGPLFPNIGLIHVGALSVLFLAQALFTTVLLRTGRYRADPERSARLVFGVDLLLVAYAIFVFAADAHWTTYIVGMLLIIAGGFRFASAGALSATTVMAASYVAVALYRERAFGHVTDPQRMAFTVSIYLLAGFLMAGLVRELATLRAQREAFEHQRAETEALRTVDRMKSEFLAAMSHDFRSPLTVVRGAIEILRSERPGALTPGQRELTGRAERNVHRLEEFAEDLLEMARIEHDAVQLERTEVDACELLREVMEDHRPFAEDRRQTLELACGRAAVVFVDASRLRRAIGNLVSNAIKYAPEGSPIIVRGAAEGAHLRVSVTDRGAGVDPDERERIFERFSRGRRSATVAGAGLGLSIARSLVELHGGRVHCEDSPGGGATFVLTVPLGIE